MRTLQRWVFGIFMVGLLTFTGIAPTPTQAATPVWRDLPHELFRYMACFDGNNADVIWNHSGNAFHWKTGAQLTNYTTSDTRNNVITWCSDDGWVYGTEFSITTNPTSGAYEYTDVVLQRRSLTQAPTTVANLTNTIAAHHTDYNGVTSVVTINDTRVNVVRSSTGTAWDSRTYTFPMPVVDVHIAQHDAMLIYVLTLPKLGYATSEALPRDRSVSQFAVWRSRDAGQNWRRQSQVALPQPCNTVILDGTVDNSACYYQQLELRFVATPTRYTSPEALAVTVSMIQDGLRIGKSVFSSNSGRTWQDVQYIQGTDSDNRYRSFFNNSTYPENLYRPIPELIFAPANIFFSPVAVQHLHTTHGYDPLLTSITQAPGMQSIDQHNWTPMPVAGNQICNDTNAADGNQVVTVASMPTVRVCKNSTGIAYSESGGLHWQHISTDNPYARLIAVSDTLPLTIVRQLCQPSPRYGRYPTLDCSTMQYLQVTPAQAVTTPITLQSPLAIPYEPVTGHSIDPRFQRYWQSNGGLAQFGFPISEPFYEVNPDDGKIYLVQYFERNRFEHHPELAGTAYEVLLGLIGSHYGAQAQLRQPGPFARQSGASEPGQLYFAETGHTLRNSFKRHWQSTGGLAQYGYPISEEFYEVNPDDGQTYVVQYFERARFEWHPELMGTPYEVLLGLLGNQLLADKGW